MNKVLLNILLPPKLPFKLEVEIKGLKFELILLLLLLLVVALFKIGFKIDRENNLDCIAEVLDFVFSGVERNESKGKSTESKQKTFFFCGWRNFFAKNENKSN